MVKLTAHLRLVSTFGIVSALFGASSGCGFSSDSDDGKATPYGGIAIAAVATDYTSSSLYYQGLENGEPIGVPKTLLTGESGDPWMALIDSQVYFFNRSTNSSNYRTLDPKTADGSPSAQVRTELASAGDPHDALKLGASRLLLAQYSAGKLVVINPTDGALKQEVTAEWDFGTDAAGVLRPEAFYRPAGATDGLIYVLHQGLTADFLGFNGSQQLFILQDDGEQVTVVDADPATPKVQGIKLNIFNPQIIAGFDNPNQPIIGGFCSVYASVTPCTSGFERVDLAARKSTLIYDLTSAAEKGNGFMTAGQGGKFYAAVAPVNAGGSPGQTKIHVFDAVQNTSESIYDIADTSYASFALNYDLTTNKLLIGEADRARNTGTITMIKTDTKGAVPQNLDLPLVPYQIRFVP